MRFPRRKGSRSSKKEFRLGRRGPKSIKRRSWAWAGRSARRSEFLERGVEDASNEMGAYMVIRAELHEAAAKLFERHPHFTIFPGEAVEIMPVLPIPGS